MISSAAVKPDNSWYTLMLNGWRHDKQDWEYKYYCVGKAVYKAVLVIGHTWDQNLTFTCLRRASLSTRVRNSCWFLITSSSTFSASFPNRVHLSLWYSSSAAKVSFSISLVECSTKFLIFSGLTFSVICVIVPTCVSY